MKLLRPPRERVSFGKCLQVPKIQRPSFIGQLRSRFTVVKKSECWILLMGMLTSVKGHGFLMSPFSPQRENAGLVRSKGCARHLEYFDFGCHKLIKIHYLVALLGRALNARPNIEYLNNLSRPSNIKFSLWFVFSIF